MNSKEKILMDEAQKSKKNYETPCIEEKSEMSFPKEVWSDFCENKWCFGCTNCSCR